MRLEDFRRFELYSGVRIPSGSWLVLRLDGRGFGRLALELRARKPFDPRLARCLVDSARSVYQQGFNPALIYVASDELNILFIGEPPFGGRVEKLDSVLSGIISSSACLNLRRLFGVETVVSFDCRVVVLDEESFFSYIAWRQLDSVRNCLNAYAYWTLRASGMSPRRAAERLRGLKAQALIKLLREHDVDFGSVPSWQKNGILIYKRPVLRTAGKVHYLRKRLTESWRVPSFLGPQGRHLLRRVVRWASVSRI